MAKAHPYLGLPDRQIWRNEPAIADPVLFDPIVQPKFTITHDEAVVTAGSCFAQHVARHLAASGFNFYVAERAHPIVPPAVAERHNYGMFSARYGNLYTARQLLQLLWRAYGIFVPTAQSWKGPGGSIVDPFRPQIQPHGFISETELSRDRQSHFAAVREAMERMRVFVFTLGLTEAWEDVRDGAVYPLAPGVAGGTFDPAIHRFRNFTVDEVTADLRAALTFIRTRNPTVKVLLTVSPVPLNATYEPRHVFVATTYSKAVLRIAAEQVCAGDNACDYFPSFEIITSPYVRGQYYAQDCRSVTEPGVSHVMNLFLHHYGLGASGAAAVTLDASKPDALLLEMERVVEVLCDEEKISNF